LGWWKERKKENTAWIQIEGKNEKQVAEVTMRCAWSGWHSHTQLLMLSIRMKAGLTGVLVS